MASVLGQEVLCDSPGVAALCCCSDNSSDLRLFRQVYAVRGIWGPKQQSLWKKTPVIWLMLRRQDG